MSDYQRRLDRLEHVIRPAAPPRVVTAIMDYDDNGNCESLTMQGVRVAPLPGESEDELCERANQAIGPFDLVILVHLVAAKDGKPAPGFERFGRHGNCDSSATSSTRAGACDETNLTQFLA